MATLLANQAIEGAIAAILMAVAGLIVAVAALIKARATEAVQQDHAKTPTAQPTIVTMPPAPTSPLVAASVQCPHCLGQVHLDSLTPTPEQP